MSDSESDLVCRYVELYRELKEVEDKILASEPAPDAALQKRIDEVVKSVSLSTFIQSVHYLRFANDEAGSMDMRGNCLFHEDETESMYVVSDKGFYHCFACGAHGNVVELNARWQGCSIKQSLEELEARFAIEGGHLAFRKRSNA